MAKELGREESLVVMGQEKKGWNALTEEEKEQMRQSISKKMSAALADLEEKASL